MCTAAAPHDRLALLGGQEVIAQISDIEPFTSVTSCPTGERTFELSCGILLRQCNHSPYIVNK